MLYTICAGFLVIFCVFKGFIYSRKRSRLPPGPLRRPLIGNLLDMQKTPIELSKWAGSFGDVVFAEIFDRRWIFLNTYKAVDDLLNQRSAVYSDRPHMVMGGDLSGFDTIFPARSADEEWKQQRRIVRQEFGTSASQILQNCTDMLQGSAVGETILRATYGYQCRDDDTLLIKKEEQLSNFNLALAPGMWLVDTLPFMKHIPSWMPGATFKRVADRWRLANHDITWSPYKQSKDKRESGQVSLPNFIDTVLKKKDGHVDFHDEERLALAASSVFGGGAATNTAILLKFMLAMTLYPDSQSRAQQEIDAVIGTDRLPNISDRSSLPFLNCIIAESYRWETTAALGVPHSLREDDYYENMYLPGESVVIPNVRHILSDEKIFPHASQFLPERYMGKPEDVKLVTDLTFGFGRRRCPGLQFAEATTFAVVATMLATCDIAEARTENGNYNFDSEMVSMPNKFKFHVRPRSAHALTLLLDATEAIY